MTPEVKQQIKTEIVTYLKTQFPSYPELEEPAEVLQKIPAIYKLLTDKGLIDPQAVPPDIFQHLAVDKFRDAVINEQLNSFF